MNTASSIGFLFLPLGWLLGYACGRRSRTPKARGRYVTNFGRSLPHGGWPKPPASPPGKAGTAQRVATFTGCLPDGPLPEGWVTRPTELTAVRNRITAPGYSGNATDGAPGLREDGVGYSVYSFLSPYHWPSA
jgi:hypothetical protein